MMTQIHIFFNRLCLFQKTQKLYLVRIVQIMAIRTERSAKVQDEVIGGVEWVMGFKSTFNNIAALF